MRKILLLNWFQTRKQIIELILGQISGQSLVNDKIFHDSLYNYEKCTRGLQLNLTEFQTEKFVLLISTVSQFL